MSRKYREWTDNDLTIAVRDSLSLADVLRKLNLRVSGGNYWNIKRNIDRLNLSIDHFTGNGWNRGVFKPIGELTNPQSIKKNLLRSNPHECTNCNLSEWFGFPIPLELHHIDGNKSNNKAENLQLICPNCHALTNNYRNKKRK